LKEYSIPIIFGITGHRDLRKKDIPDLKNSVASIFKEYKKRYPNTKLILISALAEGADMLAARVAKDLGVELHVYLPYEEEAYLNSFLDRAKNEKEYFELKNYATKVEVLDCDYTKGTTICYENLGKKIADDSNILIALWDRKVINSKGGTSAVVMYQKEGFKENRFDAMDGNAIFIITTPREKDKDDKQSKNNFEVEKIYLGNHIKEKEFNEMLKNIDEINRKIAKSINTKDSTKKDSNNSNIGKLEFWMNYFSKNAKSKQKIFKRCSVAILLLTFAAFLSLQLVAYFKDDIYRFYYIVGVLLAFLIYFIVMKSGKLQNDFVYSRGLAEALRVQNAYNGAGIKDSTARYYLKDHHHKFTWLRFALKNMTTLDKKPFKPRYSKGDKPEDWINGQIEYFQNSGLRPRYNKLRFGKVIQNALYISGVIILIAIIIQKIDSFYNLNLSIVHKYNVNWDFLVFYSGILLFAAAFIGEKYLKIAGYEEEIYNFENMLSHFKDAKDRLEGVDKNSKDYQTIIKDLGEKALQENGNWVVLHDKKRVKPSLK